MGFEPMNTGFADQRVSHFATGARGRHATGVACRIDTNIPQGLDPCYYQLSW